MTSRYDLFLSYSTVDHSIVEDCARKLRDSGVEPFLDRWYLAPGARWRTKLEETLSTCKAVAVFVGRGEMGSWQQREVDVALDLQGKRVDFPVIPVLLPGCEAPLGFLRQLTWVDLRDQPIEQGIAILIKAAHGEPPGIDLQRHFDSVRASICPYRGLLYFREEDAPFFFGREAAIETLVNAVQRQAFVAVVGASGSGKSSVVRAGVVPRLRNDRRTVWETVTLVPTGQPFKALARVLVPLLEPAIDEVDGLAKAAKLGEHFQSKTISVYDIVERILEKRSGTDRMLIVVDQFEEVYTLVADEEVRRRFLDELLATSSRPGSKANVALTLRGDFVGKALAYRPLSDRLQDAQVNLGPMARNELELAVLRPAERTHLEFEPGLISRILNDVGDEPGNLPLLEFVLKELWEKRRGCVLLNKTYEDFGGLQGAVATKADQLFKDLSPAEQKILQRVFLRIVHPSESGDNTRRRTPFDELPAGGAELVVKLANQRLLVTNQLASGQEQTVEVAHEALISSWGTLRGWVDEDREFLLWRARLDVLLAEWERARENDDACLRGPLFVEARKWFDQRNEDLSDQEKKFISASQDVLEAIPKPLL
jgi:energy-coupling factor transporter ATP-binding protein EcfA2